MKNNKTNTYVKIHARGIDDKSKEQLELIAESPAISGQVAIMPDVHAGAGCVIGFTAKMTKLIIPNLIGVDIGCGVIAYNIGKIDIDLERFDNFVRGAIPLGFKYRDREPTYDCRISELFEGVKDRLCYNKRPGHQLGTLGGGNHFIEVDVDENNNKWIIIHTGSRNFGHFIATYHQNKAKDLCNQMGLVDIPTGLEYLPYDYGGYDYLQDVEIAQMFASLNRAIILKDILNYFDLGFDVNKCIESTHNYIDDSGMIRKGAISSHKNENVVIPLNMADGCIIGVGKGNKDYNYSAPHGAGRSHGRKEMFRLLDEGKYTLDDFEKSMKDVYSTSVCKDTFDESKFAYKTFSHIEKYLKETVDIERILKPIYNLKSD